MDATAGEANTLSLDDMLEQQAPSGQPSRGRPRRLSRENMLNKDHMLAGTDEKGVRIRIFTASLTGKRATLVCPDPDKPHLAESTYVGGLIDADTEGSESQARPHVKPTLTALAPPVIAYTALDSRLPKCLRCPASSDTATARSRTRLALTLRDSGSTTGAKAWAHTPSPVVRETIEGTRSRTVDSHRRTLSWSCALSLSLSSSLPAPRGAHAHR